MVAPPFSNSPTGILPLAALLRRVDTPKKARFPHNQLRAASPCRTNRSLVDLSDWGSGCAASITRTSWSIGRRSTGSKSSPKTISIPAVAPATCSIEWPNATPSSCTACLSRSAAPIRSISTTFTSSSNWPTPLVRGGYPTIFVGQGSWVAIPTISCRLCSMKPRCDTWSSASVSYKTCSSAR